MRRDDPLEKWLRWSEWGTKPEVVAEGHAYAHAGLNELSELLDRTPERPDMNNVPLWVEGRVGPSPEDLPRAQDLYHRVFHARGAGHILIQESLLNLIAAAEDPTSIPFWLEVLNLSRPRDQFARRRRTIALAALVRLAVQQETPAAYEALQGLTQHARPDVRALAVYYLGQAYLYSERSIPPEVLADLLAMAVEDKAFGPRFQACSVLRQVGETVPMDNPDGVYAFKVKFMWDKRIYRTIELRSHQTLEDLHYAIQRAIDWDADHLYSFHMSGELYNLNYAYACPYEEDSPPWTDEAIIGELGLVAKHKFLYYFDYGDSHRFEVQVVDIRPQVEAAEYPRVVKHQGEAPPQYRR